MPEPTGFAMQEVQTRSNTTHRIMIPRITGVVTLEERTAVMAVVIEQL